MPSVYTVDSIEALVGLPSSVTETVVYVKSYYPDGLKGGGTFVYAAGDTSSADGFLTIVDGTSRHWKRVIGPEGVDAYMAGAYGDAQINGSSGLITSGHDDSAAMNALTAYIRNKATSASGSSSMSLARVNIGSGVFLVSTALDFTNLRDFGWGVDFTGSVICSKTSKEYIIDCTHSRQGTLINPHVYGEPSSNRPAIGIKLGRKANDAAANDMVLIRPVAKGEFEGAAMLNVCSEGMTMINPELDNDIDAATRAYAYVADSYNCFEYDKWQGTFTIGSIHATQGATVATSAPHGLATGRKVMFEGTSAGAWNLLLFTILSIIDSTSFKIDKFSGSAPTTTGAIMWTHRFNPRYITDYTMRPWTEESFKDQTIIRGRFHAQKCFAAVFEGAGENHRYTACHTLAGWMEDGTTVALWAPWLLRPARPWSPIAATHSLLAIRPSSPAYRERWTPFWMPQRMEASI